MPYLGMGPLFSLYPLFRLEGGDLAASVYAAHVACLLTAAAYPMVVFRVLLKTSLTHAVLLAVLMIQLLAVLPHTPNWASWAMTPGNSLRPLRAVLPVLIALCWFEINLRVSSETKRAFALGCLTGLAACWSNDFALLSVLGLLLGVPIHERRCKSHLSARFLATFLITSITAIVALYLIGTAGHSIEILQYNFRDVAHDQWWYFGSYHPVNRVFAVPDVLQVLRKIEPDQFAIFSLLLLHWHRTRGSELDQFIWALLILGGGGLVACVGGHIDNYFGGLQMLLLISGWATFLFVLYHALASRMGPIRMVVPLLMTSVMAAHGITQHRLEQASLASNTQQTYVKELGGYMSTAWIPYLRFFREHPDSIIFEEYWGVASAMHPERNFASGTQVDAAIHALGQQRNTVESQIFNRADFIVTTKPDFSTWQSWSVSQNFWLYGELFDKWEPAFNGPSTVVWRKRAQHPQQTELSCGLDPSGRSVLIPSPETGAYKVSFDLHVTDTSRRILVHLRNNFSLGGDAGGRVYLPPRGGQIETIVYKTRTKSESFPLGLTPEDSPHNIAITNCRYRAIPPQPAEALALPWLPTAPISSHR